MSKGVNSPHIDFRLSENFDRTTQVLNSNIETLISSGKRIVVSLESLSQQHNPIYDEIVREFVNIERREENLWTRIGWESSGASIVRKMKIRENKELLTLVGSYEEKARGYVENVLLELESMVGEMEVLQKRVSENLLGFGVKARAGSATEIPLERQLEAVEQTVASILNERTRRTRSSCSMGRIINRGARNETRSYRNIFTPTRTSKT